MVGKIVRYEICTAKNERKNPSGDHRRVGSAA